MKAPKMSHLRRLAVLALGFTAMAGMAPTPTAVTQQANKQTQSQKSQKEALASNVAGSNEIVVQSAGGFDVMSYNPGIPPHIYGQNCVRKGTHKRTNRKRFS